MKGNKMKKDKDPWLQFKNVIKESTIEVVDGFADISKMLFGQDSKKKKK